MIPRKLLSPAAWTLACLCWTLFESARWTSPLMAQHQTENFSPVILGSSLPYHIQINSVDWGPMESPTLHSYAKAQWDGKWLLIGGRSNGLHGFTQNGFENFPPAFQNRDVWVIDPVNRQSWHRSLDDAASGLTVAQVDSLAVTNNQFYQDGERLYLTGGYGFLTDFDFVTFDALTAVDVPSLMDWVQGGSEMLGNTIRQIHDPLFTVTGGAMLQTDGRTHLVFGQNFQGEYTHFGNGEYTKQVRSFTIVDDGQMLVIEGVVLSERDESYRRRDLNVLPVMRAGDDGLQEAIRVLSGVFTPEGGAWTVPVQIAADGTPSMPDPEDEATFKQAMNAYHSAKLGLYSEQSDQMHMLVFGGISLNFFDEATQEIVRDDFLPFINQSTSIVIDGQDQYTQYLLPNTFPEIVDLESGKQLLFGTNAEFMIADGIATFENGVIQMDSLSTPTTLGYILGGIAADQPNRGNTTATGHAFEVVYTPASFYDCNIDGSVDGQDLACANQAGILAGVLEYTGFVLGDMDVDGSVAFSDFLILSQNFGQPHNDYTQGDLDGSGDVAFSDFLILSQNFGERSRALLVPEPDVSTWLCFFVAVLVSVRPPRARAMLPSPFSPRTSNLLSAAGIEVISSQS